MKKFNNHKIRWTALGIIFIGTFSALAEDKKSGPEMFWDGKNRINLRMQSIFNYSVEFRNLPTPSSAGPAVGGGGDRSYEDGYVRKDISGNVGGKTWNWGYANNAQVSGGNLAMHAFNSPADGSANKQGGALRPGFELSYNRFFKTYDWGIKQGQLGLEAAFGMVPVHARNSQTVNGTVSQITDRYALSFVPPLAPYQGTFNGPGTLLPDAPTRTLSTDPATANVNQTLTGEMYGLKLGPCLNVVLGEQWAAGFSLGLAAAAMNLKLRSDETVTVNLPGGLTANRLQSAHGTELALGFYAQTQLTCAITKSTAIILGAGYQRLGDSSVRSPSKSATLKMDGAINAFVGLGFSF